MSNHNAAPVFGDTDDKEDSKDSLFDSVKPVSDKSINFLLNSENLAAKQAQEQERQKTLTESLFSKDKKSEALEDDNDSSESATSSKKSKRFNRSFKQLFNKVVEKAPAASASSVESTESVEAVIEQDEVEQGTLKIEHLPPSEESTVETDPDAKYYVQPSEEEAPAVVHEDSVEEEDDPWAPPSASAAAPPPPTPPRRPVTASGSSGGRGSSGSGRGGGGGTPPPAPPFGGGAMPPPPPQPNFNTAAANPAVPNPNVLNNPNQQVTVIERGGVVGPLIAFVAANYFSRRRRKRTIREQAKQDKRMDNIEAQAVKDRSRTNIRETQNRQQHYAYDQRLNQVERTLDAPQPPKPRIEQAPANIINQELNKNEIFVTPPAETVGAAQKMSEVIAEVAKDKGLDTAPGMANIPPAAINPNVAKYEESSTEKVNAEKIQRQVEENQHRLFEQQSAKLNKSEVEKIMPPIVVAENNPDSEGSGREDLLNRRHEVKDSGAVAGMPQMSGGASSDSSSNSSSGGGQGQQPISGVFTQGQQSQQTDTNKFQTKEEQQEFYKRSIRAGIIVGGAFIVLGTIAYLLFG